MAEKKLTHYRKEFKSPYLASADVITPVVLTVVGAKYEKDQTHRSKEEIKVLIFEENLLPTGEKVKPMVLNAGNNEIIRKFAGGSKYIEEWSFGFKITIFVDPNVRWGSDIVEGLRIKAEKPKDKPALSPCSKEWGNAVQSYIMNKSFEQIEKHRTITAANKKKIIAEAKAITETKTQSTEEPK